MLDWRERGIGSDDYVDRRKISLPLVVAEPIVPDMISVPGAWLEVDEDGVDHGGSMGLLTILAMTPLAQGSNQSPNFVHGERA